MRDDQRTTSSGIPLQVCYGPEDSPLQTGRPGEFPFTRGIRGDLYRGRLWTMRQYAGFGTAEESNRRYRYLLDQGTTGLSVAFDLPTQIGYDSDDPIALGEVGRVGVAIDSIEDMETLFDSIPLDKVSVSMTINATAPILLAIYIALARRRGFDPAKLRGTIQNDILKEYAARGTYIYPPEPSMRLTADIFEYGTEQLASFNTISVSGYHMREAGCTAAQEIGFTLAHAIAYMEAAKQRGVPLAAFAKRLSFFFNAHNQLLEEVAKFRAARTLWAEIVSNRFGIDEPRSQLLRFHTQTAGSTLTAREPEVNVVRVAIQALAAVFGGTQSLHTNARDEALSLPSEASARLAIRTQQVIAHESGVPNTVDPFGGSYAIEALTGELLDRARGYIARIDDLGGAIAALEAGYTQSEIEEAAYATQRDIEEGRLTVVGVNRFCDATDVPGEDNVGFDTLCLDPAIERRQAERVAALRGKRNRQAATTALSALREAARGEANLMPSIIEAVERQATLGEIAGCLRDVFGEYRKAG